ncbi:K02A2.6-like [Cordylochernes scorpioides]|uniref:K02A2.6-like n=1 Tax=Cordylochernes scorpioides TaxID=51811 RepID=A0ABY6LHC7_9ARAC|nr:K02A2.6-like [Cordylochernes scorpioides]
MSNIPVPAPILINSQTAEIWRFFKSQWDNYQVATELNKKDNNVIRATFLSLIGKDCFNVFLNLDLKEDEKNSLPKIIEALNNHFTPQKNVIYERYILIHRIKKKMKIVNINQKPLLSAKTIEDLNLVTKHDAVYHLANSSCSRAESIINKYEDVFKGLGMLPKEYHIEIEKETTPVQQHLRRIPIVLKAEFKRKLDDLEGRGIIERVQKSSSWISNLVLVKKQNKL